MRFIYLFIVFCIFCACENNQKSIVLDSSGNINSVSVVIDKDMWNSRLGDSIRDFFSSSVYGLPQPEPKFTLNYIPINIFSGFVTRSRSILMIKLSKTNRIQFLDDTYARPQKMVVVEGKDLNQIITSFNDKKDSIISVFKETELKEKMRRIKKSLYKTDAVEKTLKVKLNFPSSYRIAKLDSNFIWIRRDISSGSLNLLICRNLNDRQALTLRDSISKAHIPGPIDGTFMKTDYDYIASSNVFETEEKLIEETRGLWDVEKQFMGGPFINQKIKTKNKEEVVMLDAFLFAPGEAKRDYLFELEAIMRTFNIISD